MDRDTARHLRRSDEDNVNEDHEPCDFDDEDEYVPSNEELRDDAPLTTDSANAEAVVADHGKSYVYVQKWAFWLAWDGRRWAEAGAEAQMHRSIIQSMRARYSAAKSRRREAEERIQHAALTMQKDEAAERASKREKSLLKWYEQSQNQSRIAACRAGMQAHLGITHDQLDRSPWLLNVANGTIDLRTAELRDHDRSDMLTQIADVAYDDNARAPTWDAFLSSAMGADIQLSLYLQRWAGYMATGHVTEHALLFLHGGGRNGKSTFVTTLCKVLGEYACSAPRELLFISKNEKHPTEIARLHAKRIVSCAEVPENASLDEAKVKDLTGGDVVSARRMNENFWDLHPTHKFVLSGNHKPNIRGSDDGIWRRLRLVPWLVQVAEGNVDKALPEKLYAERDGILRWIVQGCLEWQRIGLCDPEVVKGATGEYREESDATGKYILERVVFGREEVVPRAEIRKAYETWCEEQGYQPIGAKRFAQRLRESGVREGSKRVGSTVVNAWRGCRLRHGNEMTEH